MRKGHNETNDRMTANTTNNEKQRQNDKQTRYL